MTKKVKETPRKRVSRPTTRISSKHQVTIPALPFRAAGFQPGDTVRVEASGSGTVVLTRVDELIERYAGALDSGGELRREVDALRDEWR
jgi:bifunctional DNA-binding transcriptional regulator/antitoxin component of YhaV-PrlF toxin-antitoxin module